MIQSKINYLPKACLWIISRNVLCRINSQQLGKIAVNIVVENYIVSFFCQFFFIFLSAPFSFSLIPSMRLLLSIVFRSQGFTEFANESLCFTLLYKKIHYTALFKNSGVVKFLHKIYNEKFNAGLNVT